MYSESGSHEIKKSETILAHDFDAKELQGLFLNRGKEKTLVVYSENWSQENEVVLEIFRDTISHLDAIDSTQSAPYFPKSFIFGVWQRFGQNGLEILFKILREKNIEWGAQLRPEEITPSLARQMYRAGCSYVLLDAPSASNELLKAAGNEQTTSENLARAIDYLDAESIRIGMNLEVGITGRAEKSGHEFEVFETKNSLMQTFAFVRRQLQEGKNLVSVKLSLFDDPEGKAAETRTYPYNRFGNGVKAKTKYDEKFLDFAVNTAVKEIGEVLRGQDLYSVDSVYGMARSGMLKDFVDLNSASITTPVLSAKGKLALESLRVTARDVSKVARRPGKMERLLDDATFQDLDFTKPGNVNRLIGEDFWLTVERARFYLAKLMGVKAKEQFPNLGVSGFFRRPDGATLADDHIALAPNTTQAMNWAMGMVAISEKLINRKHKNENQPTYLITDAEHYSARRLMRSLSDKGNLHGREQASSFQDFGINYDYATSSHQLKKQDLDWVGKEAKVLHPGSDYNIASQVDSDTKMVIFSHVVRDTGEILDAARICRAIKERNPNCWILVDGAQAFGALPKFSVTDLGCDFYVATPHKTLNSYPFGVLYMSDRAVNVAPKLINKRQAGTVNVQIPKRAFSLLVEVRDVAEPKHIASKDGIISPYEPASLVLNYFPEDRLVTEPDGRVKFPEYNREQRLDKDLYKGVDRQMEKVESVRAELKTFALELFGQNFGSQIEILSPQDKKHSNFIFSFTFPTLDNRKLAEALWVNHHIGLTYVARSNCIRTSFSPFNSPADIEKLVLAIKTEMAKPGYELPTSLQKS